MCFLIGYRRIMNDFQAEEEVDKIMKSVDKNNSGAIDYTGILDRNAIKN